MLKRSTFLAAMLAAACSSAQQPGAPATRHSPAASTGRANLAASPAKPFAVETLAHFDAPFAMAFLPYGALLVTEKGGKLKILDNRQTFEIDKVPAVATGGQGGLLDIAVAPDFQRSGYVYLSYAEPAPGGSQLALARGKLVLMGLRCAGCGSPYQFEAAPTVIWRSGSPGQGGQFGAVIAFAPDGKSLFLASGERQRFTPAQAPDQALGKIVHLTLDGQPAADNPGFGRTGAATVGVIDPPKDTAAATAAPTRPFAFDGPNLAPAVTWSSGHRNPYGLAFDHGGRLWEVEMGPKGGDEVNLITKGRNYGWPRASNGDNYDGLDIPDHRDGDGFEAPRAWWNPSISPGGMAIYDGALFPAWRGSMLVAALGGQALIRLALDGDRAKAVEQWDMGTRIRDVAVAPDGAVWLLEDGGKGAGGALMRLVPAK